MLPTDPGDLVKLAVDIIIDQIEKRGLRLIKKVQEEIKNRRKKQAYSPRVELVNRESERRAIQVAVEDDAQLRILYLVGEGGTGKTRLLQDAEHFIQRGRRSSLPLRWAGLFDFYHTELHSVTAIQRAIIEGLDPNEQYFHSYRRAQDRFGRLLMEGLVGPVIEEERKKLSDLFFTDYQTFSQRYRPVIAFDTLESLTHEADWVENLCSLEDTPVAAREWMIGQIGRLENSVILMAGRPHPSFRNALEKENNRHSGQLEIIEVKGLTREDTRQFLAMLLKDAPPSLRILMANADRLWQITRGLPVQLALAVDLASHGEFVLQEDEGIIADAGLWGQRLVDDLFSKDNPGRRLFFLLALARKGMTAGLLHYLEPSRSTAECQRELDRLRTSSIIKMRPDSSELFLHDALYELFDIYFPPGKSLAPWYDKLADYHRLKYLSSELESSQDSQKAVNFLYYELQRNPRNAFDSVYLPLRERALKGHELELDLQLRDELLRFIRSPMIIKRQYKDQTPTQAEVDRDGVVRWLKRYIIQAKYQDAIQIAETLLTLGPSKFKSYIAFPVNRFQQDSKLPSEEEKHTQNILNTNEPFFWGQLLTCYCEGLIYSSAPESGLEQILRMASALVKNSKLKSDASLKWLYERTSGRLNDRKGYLFRTNGHYGKAVEAYEEARVTYKSPDLDEISATLNNLAFTLALLGDTETATQHVNEALEIRQGLGQKYPLALSRNTSGLICALQGQYEKGRKESQSALNIFEELETPRGKGLAFNALGYILRKQAERWKSDQASPAEAVSGFQQANDYLERAEEIFSGPVPEPIRLWEAHNEQGSLHREWGKLLQDQGETEAAQTQYARAMECQLQALEIAQKYKMHFQEADTYDDLAKVARDQGNYQQAKRWLQRAWSLIPKEYTSQTGKKGKHIPPAGEAYWLILAKVHLQEGTWALESLTKRRLSERRHQEYTQSVFENFALASYYFERYWPGTSANQQRFRSMADQVSQLGLPVREIKRAIKEEGNRHNINVSAFLEMFTNS